MNSSTILYAGLPGRQHRLLISRTG